MDVERRFSEAPKLEDRGDGKSVIVGYAAVFSDGTPGTEFDMRRDGTLYERVMPGAFDSALKEGRDVHALFNHDPSLLLGRLSSGTLRISVDKRGLAYEIDPPDTSTGRDMQELVRRGDVKGSSFSFRARKQEFVREQREGRTVTVRELRELDVMDVGPVTFAAYGSTDVEVAKRSLEEFERELQSPWRRENARRRLSIMESQLTAAGPQS